MATRTVPYCNPPYFSFSGRLGTIASAFHVGDPAPTAANNVPLGIVSEEDTEKVINLGADGIIVSNHGGRQIDSGESTIKSLKSLADKYGDRLKIMVDSGLRSGPDIAKALACGADFTFMGRPFMYGIGALGKQGVILRLRC